MFILQYPIVIQCYLNIAYKQVVAIIQVYLSL